MQNTGKTNPQTKIEDHTAPPPDNLKSRTPKAPPRQTGEPHIGSKSREYRWEQRLPFNRKTAYLSRIFCILQKNINQVSHLDDLIKLINLIQNQIKLSKKFKKNLIVSIQHTMEDSNQHQKHPESFHAQDRYNNQTHQDYPQFNQDALQGKSHDFNPILKFGQFQQQAQQFGQFYDQQPQFQNYMMHGDPRGTNFQYPAMNQKSNQGYQQMGYQQNSQAYHQNMMGQLPLRFQNSEQLGTSHQESRDNYVLPQGSGHDHMQQQPSNYAQNQEQFNSLLPENTFESPMKMKPPTHIEMEQLLNQQHFSHELGNRRQDNAGKLVPQQVLQKIPQTVIYQKRKVSGQHKEQLGTEIYYQEGNQEVESVNKLTDFNCPSVDGESNPQVRKEYQNEFINMDFLNDDDDEIGDLSDKNFSKASNYGPEPHSGGIVVSLKRGSNSLGRPNWDNNNNFETDPQMRCVDPSIGNHPQYKDVHNQPVYPIAYNNFNENQMQGQPNQTQHQNQNNQSIFHSDFSTGIQVGMQEYQQNHEFIKNMIPHASQRPNRGFFKIPTKDKSPEQYQNELIQQQQNYNLQMQRISQAQYPINFGHQQYPGVYQVPNQQFNFVPDQMHRMQRPQYMQDEQTLYSTEFMSPQIYPSKSLFHQQMSHQGYDPFSQQQDLMDSLNDLNLDDRINLEYTDQRRTKKSMSEKECKASSDRQATHYNEGKKVKPKLLDNRHGSNSHNQNNRSKPMINQLDVGDINVQHEENDTRGQKFNKKGAHSNYGNRYQYNKQRKSQENQQRTDYGGLASDKFGSSGPHSNKATTTTLTKGSHGSSGKESFDEFLLQIQHDIKLANEDPALEFKVLEGKILKLAQKKVGSQFLQKHLSKCKQSLVNKIIEQVEDDLAQLMTDNYGNYFCSVLIDYLQVHQRVSFLRKIKGEKFVEISCNNRGTWVLQTIIKAFTENEEYEIIKQTLTQNDNICRLAKDIQGQHMIQKIIETFSEERKQYIFDEIIRNFEVLAIDKQGLCVMKKLIKHTKKKELQRKIVDILCERVMVYVQNEYGNFVVSEVLQNYDFDTCKGIYDKIKHEFVKLSKNKYSSKFIEIFIEQSPQDIQTEIIKEFVESTQLANVVESSFGNYVLQKILKTCSKSQDSILRLIDAIIECLLDVNDFKVQQKWGKEILYNCLGDYSLQNYNFKQTQELQKKLDDVMDQAQINNRSQKNKQMQKRQNQKSSDGNSSGTNRKYEQSGDIDFSSKRKVNYEDAKGPHQTKIQNSKIGQTNRRNDPIVIDSKKIVFANKK